MTVIRWRPEPHLLLCFIGGAVVSELRHSRAAQLGFVLGLILFVAAWAVFFPRSFDRVFYKAVKDA